MESSGEENESEIKPHHLAVVQYKIIYPEARESEVAGGGRNALPCLQPPPLPGLHALKESLHIPLGHHLRGGREGEGGTTEDVEPHQAHPLDEGMEGTTTTNVTNFSFLCKSVEEIHQIRLHLIVL